MEAVIYFVGLIFLISIFYVIVSVLEYHILKNQYCDKCDDIKNCDKDECKEKKGDILIKRED